MRAPAALGEGAKPSENKMLDSDNFDGLNSDAINVIAYIKSRDYISLTGVLS
jgi:hypothetical protein